MNFEIRGQHVQITDTIRAYVERRLSFALDRFGERIRVVRLKIGDVNSSRGGEGKHCHLEVSFEHSSPITVESRDLTVQGAIDRVSNRIGSLVAQHFGRNRQRRRAKTFARQLLKTPFFSVRTPLMGGTTS